MDEMDIEVELVGGADPAGAGHCRAAGPVLSSSARAKEWWPHAFARFEMKAKRFHRPAGCFVTNKTSKQHSPVNIKAAKKR